MIKISTKVIVALIVSSLVVISAGSYVSITTSKELLKEEAELNLRNIVTLEGRKIDEAINNIPFLCDVLEVQLLNQLDLEKVSNDYDAMQTLEETLIESWNETIDTFGLNSGWIAFDSLVIPGGHTIFSFRRNGQIIREPEYDIRDFGYEKDPWYANAIANGENWTEPYLWEDWDNTMLITYSRPVEVDGTIVGVIGSEFFLENLIDRLSKIEVYETGYVTLIDESFNFIYHPKYSGDNLNNIDQGRLNHLANEIKNSALGIGTISYEFEGVKKVLAYYKLENGWVLTANPTEPEIFTNMNLMTNRILVAAVFVLMMALLLAILLGRSIAKPLEVLAKNALELANGNYKEYKDFDKTNILEISTLQNNFDVMTENIMARENELKEFVYIASHDLQEPLRMVSSYLQILEKKYKGKLDEKADRYIFYAVDGAKRMKTLIGDLLLYSRLSQDFETQAVDLNQVLKDVEINLSLAIRDTQAKVNCEILPCVKADRMRMIQLFQNVIGNALKYRRDETPVIDITLITTLKYWEIIVSDNGIGFKQENADRIFEVFRRLHTKEQYSGTGVGLSICKKIMLQHNGEIKAESEPGVGSKFIIRLPINEEAS